MDRLTQRREDGGVVVHKKAYSGFHLDYMDTEFVNDQHHIKLAEYEDTGLTPEEIAALKNKLAVTEKALELACNHNPVGNKAYWLNQAMNELEKEGEAHD